VLIQNNVNNDLAVALSTEQQLLLDMQQQRRQLKQLAVPTDDAQVRSIIFIEGNPHLTLFRSSRILFKSSILLIWLLFSFMETTFTFD
jgi:hypothetical protein